MQMNNLTIEQEMKQRNITVEQMSRANTLIQKLVADCERVWSGKCNGHTSFDTYDLIDKIYETIHGENKEAVKEFAEKLQERYSDYLYKTNFDGQNDNVIDYFTLCQISDELLEEYKK